MEKIDLIQTIHRRLQQNPEGINRLTLTLELSCTPSGLSDAIATMQNQYGAPIQYREVDRTYYYDPEQPPFQLPGIWLTAQELRGIVTVLNILRELNDGLVANELDQVQQQLQDYMQQRGLKADDITQRIKVLSVGRRSVNNVVYQQVTDALFGRKQIEIQYASIKQTISRRKISPQTLVLYRDNWYLDAYCHQRQQLRTFMLSRINSAVISAEDAIEFNNHELKQHFHNSYGIFSGENTHTAELLFSAHVAHHVAQQQWHPHAKGQWQGDDYQLTLPYNDQRELLRDLLAYAPDVQIIAPIELREAYVQRLEDALNINQ
jgi:predicted DNA-binding transcriptional regulator YafY